MDVRSKFLYLFNGFPHICVSYEIFYRRALPHLVSTLADLEKKPAVIKNGFRKAGIYPPNPEAINYSACAPSKKFGTAESAGQGEDEGNLVTGGCAVGEVVKEAGNALEAPARLAVINFNLGLAERKRKFEAFRHSVLSAEEERECETLYEEGYRQSEEKLFEAYSYLRTKAEVNSTSAAQEAVSRLLPTSFSASKKKKTSRLPDGRDRYDPQGESWRRQGEEATRMADEKNEKAEEKRRKAEEKLQAAAARKEELERKRAKNRSSVSKKSLVDALAQQNLPTYGNKVFLDKSITLYNICRIISLRPHSSKGWRNAGQSLLLQHPMQRVTKRTR